MESQPFEVLPGMLTARADKLFFQQTAQLIAARRRSSADSTRPVAVRSADYCRLMDIAVDISERKLSAPPSYLMIDGVRLNPIN
jgi:hypothetical protein